MAFEAYPKWITLPGSTSEILVQNATEHEAKNPADYAASLMETKASQRTVDEAIADERERCAVVASLFRNGKEIAEAIRKGGSPPSDNVTAFRATRRAQLAAEEAVKAADAAKPKPPTLAEVLKTGYSQSVAERIVTEQQAAFEAGYPPYGTNDPDDDDPLGVKS